MLYDLLSYVHNLSLPSPPDDFVFSNVWRPIDIGESTQKIHQSCLEVGHILDHYGHHQAFLVWFESLMVKFESVMPLMMVR